uniref:Uncharacterized protein n=1 Tax=Arundo donax TaxID=35708 RepID=A0A0A8ZH75_ARUDO
MRVHGKYLKIHNCKED